MIALALAAALLAAPVDSATLRYQQLCADPRYHDVCPAGTSEAAPPTDNPVDWSTEVEALIDELCRQAGGSWNGTTCVPRGSQ